MVQEALPPFLRFDSVRQPLAGGGTVSRWKAEDELLPRTAFRESTAEKILDGFARTLGEGLGLREHDAQVVAGAPGLDLGPTPEFDEPGDVDRLLLERFREAVDEDFPIRRRETQDRRAKEVSALEDGAQYFGGAILHFRILS